MNYFYDGSLDNSVSQFALEPEESRHIVKVLRKQAGDRLAITNGKGYLFTTEILEANPKRCTVRVLESRKTPPPHFELHLAVAPPKRVERFQWFLEKATEIGVTRITPLICERSERQTLPVERLQRVVQEAMKQSLQTFLPVLEPPVRFAEYLERELPALRFIAHCEEGEKMDLKRRVAADKDTVVLIGPEGDFSHAEIQAAYQQGYVPVSLGKNRLRTETAALVACVTINLINNG